MLSYVAKHSKQRKTTKLIKLQWIALIWCQNEQKTINYKRNQITSNLHRFDMKRSKMLSYVAKHSKQRTTTKVIKLQRIASIWCQKHQTNAKLQKWSYYDEIASIWRQNDQNNAKLQTRSNYDQFASIWRQNIKTIKNVVFRRKTFKKTQNYESDQIIMNCIDLK